MAAMKKVNPNFVPRGWILDEVIKRVEKGGERDVLKRVLHLALHPFEDSWAGREFDGVVFEGDKEEEVRWTSDVPRTERALQCSCSS
jgi:serine/tyrosine/threonine adenylyltransferase